ncbi:MAG: two-component system response regulator KdpE [Gammaproteobacteria bacterium]|nr:two-component system response regulator KdpE [Gammaproteobacteria bacterium]MBU1725625.1 two-component system response regulator KdpE [Gammaproteobacteria bacterium]MBU2004023.1 two-component system response regulator KdpE [Gammaproteobacteria bacterium]
MSSLTPAYHVVLIEDEAQIRRFVRTALEAEHCSVTEAETAERGVIEAGTRKPDLVVLDLGLPDRDGIEVIHDIRAWSGVPILILSARSLESEKVRALDAGADDYLTKPFGIAELQARVRALLRRSGGGLNAGETCIHLGEIRVDLLKRQVWRGEEEIHLTPIEYRLLTRLITNIGKVVTQRQLLREVWGPGHVDDTHYLRVYMAGLRRKLELDPALPRHIRTEPGVGYRLLMD